MIGSCLIQLAALVVTFKGPESQANISMSVSHSGADLSSFLLQFKTSQANTRIARMTGLGWEMFTVDIRSGYLQIVYNMNGTRNGTTKIRSHLVNTDKWFLLNISSKTNETFVRLTKSDQSASASCVADSSIIINTTLLDRGFQNLFNKEGMSIGGETNDGSLEPFEGCLGIIKLGDHPVILFNSSEGNKTDMYFTRHASGISQGCPCPKSPCSESALYIWDRMRGSCVCKCSEGYQGMFCNTTLEGDEDDLDEKLVYLVAGITAGVLVFVGFVVCVVYCKRSTSSMFGVYNPKSEEQVQGQQMKATIQVPVPEKLI